MVARLVSLILLELLLWIGRVVVGICVYFLCKAAKVISAICILSYFMLLLLSLFSSKRSFSGSYSQLKGYIYMKLANVFLLPVQYHC